MAVPHLRSSSLALAFVAGLAAATVFAWRAPVARASAADLMTLTSDSSVHLATPAFLQIGKRYAFTWSGGGPPQTFTIKGLRPDGWILVEVADETIKPELYIPGEFPTRWLHVGLAVSIQEMRPLP